MKPLNELIQSIQKARLFISASRELIKIVAPYKVGKIKAPLFHVEAKAFSKCTNLLSDDHLDSYLNDAGSVLAALNLTKDLPDREEYWKRLYGLVDKHMTTQSEQLEEKAKQEAIRISFDTIKEREARIAEKDERIKELQDQIIELENIINYLNRIPT